MNTPVTREIMKVKTALWKMKEAYKKWNPKENWDEFWQETLVILREFEKDIKEKNEK